MVIFQRNELSRNRLLYILAIVLAVSTLVTVLTEYGRSSQTAQAAYILLGIAAVGVLALSVIQLYSIPKRSHALIIQRDQEMIVATNAIHEGFKLRFLRDVLSENVFSLSDEDRAKWKMLEADGYYASLLVRNIRKVLLVRLCTMAFDDVYIVDNTNRWEHYDCSNTAEPSFHKREMPPIRAWNQTQS